MLRHHLIFLSDIGVQYFEHRADLILLHDLVVFVILYKFVLRDITGEIIIIGTAIYGASEWLIITKGAMMPLKLWLGRPVHANTVTQIAAVRSSNGVLHDIFASPRRGNGANEWVW